MQRGDEHGALDRKLERALLQQMGQDIGDAEPLQIRPNSIGPPIRFRRNRQRAFGVLVERVDEQHLIGELGPEAMREASAPEARNSSARPTLAITLWRTAAPSRLVLDDLHVAAFAGLLEAEEHGPSLSSTTDPNS